MTKEKNKKIPYGRQSITDADIKAVTDVLHSEYITQGPKILEFEKEIARYHCAEYAVSFSNGTAALHGAYKVAGVRDGDEIITSPITFVATANAALYCGAKPAFVDIDMHTYCIDIKEIHKKVSSKTKVITPVSFGGYPVDLKQIKDIADENHSYVIHDAAHAIGSKRTGSFGMEYSDMAVLSFHPVKHITTGEGGAVLTNDKELYDKLLLFRNHGITKNAKKTSDSNGGWYYEMQMLGHNYRLTDIQSALGISQLKRINENLRSRNITASKYNRAFSISDQLITPPDIGFEIIEQMESDKIQNLHSYHLYPLRIRKKEKRLEFYNYLHEKGILAQIHYIPIYRQPYYKKLFSYKVSDYPNAEEYYESEISIPMYHNMCEEDIDYVVDTILKYKFI